MISPIAVSMAAFGFYVDNVRSSHRTEARAALNATAGSLEKCKSLYGTYNHASCNVALNFASDNGYYQITGAVNPTTFTLTATAQGGQADDDDCDTLTLTNTGVTGATGLNTAECW